MSRMQAGKEFPSFLSTLRLIIQEEYKERSCLIFIVLEVLFCLIKFSQCLLIKLYNTMFKRVN